MYILRASWKISYYMYTQIYVRAKCCHPHKISLYLLFWQENIFKVDHLKQVYLTKLPDDARKTFATAVNTETPDYTSPGRNRFKNTPLDFTLPYSFHQEMKSTCIGNHIARFKNIYLRKVTKLKIHGAITCLLTVCKSVSHYRLLP